jgi:Flp pilus assembly protein TadD
VELCNQSNLQAINLLHQQRYKEALDLLKQAQSLSENNPRCLAITYNNLACYYKK